MHSDKQVQCAIGEGKEQNLERILIRDPFKSDFQSSAE